MLLLTLLLTLARAADWADDALARVTPPHPEPAYHFADEVFHEIAAVAKERPEIVRPFLVGHTTQDRPIWGFRVSDPATPVRRKMLVFANIHALEWVPTEDALAFLLDTARDPVPGVEVTVIPVLNPDGRAKVEDDLRAGRNEYRRGNGAVNAKGKPAPVDLNRDFAVNAEPRAVWQAIIPGRYAHSAVPLSQPESQALDRLADAERFDVAVSLHAFGGYFYYPWAGRWERPADWATYDALSLRMQAAMGKHAYKPRQLSRWGFFFRAQGAELDHLYGKYGTLTWLVETTRSGLSPFRPKEWKVHFRWYNPRDPAPHVEGGRRFLRELLVAVGEPGFVGSAGIPALPPQEGRGRRAPAEVTPVGGSGQETTLDKVRP